MGRLGGKKVLISGGSGGMGKACALKFAAEDASVAVGDIVHDDGRKIVEAIKRDGGEAIYVPLDVTSEESWKAAVAAAENAFGGLTTLLNVAGIAMLGNIRDGNLDSWHRQVAINQTGTLLGMRAACEALLRSGNASILNISSLYGLFGSPFFIGYHASKAAVRLMSKAAALEFATMGIRVNTIFPGRILTPILSKGLTKEEFEATSREIERQIPMQRTGEPEDIACGALYLCSDEANYVSGAELVIDGGWSAGQAF